MGHEFKIFEKLANSVFKSYD